MKLWPSKNSGEIFINYRRTDVPGFAGRLADSLADYFGEGRIFRDIEDINPGAKFDAIIGNSLKHADAMVVVIGPEWVETRDSNGNRRLDHPEDWVAGEIEAAIKAGLPIVPVLMDGAQFPRKSDLPERIQDLVMFNAITIQDISWETDVTRLAKVLELDLPGSLAERQLKKIRLLISVGLLGVVAATMASIVYRVLMHLDTMCLECDCNVLQAGNPCEWCGTEYCVEPLSPTESAAIPIAVMAASILLVAYRQLFDESSRRVIVPTALISGFAMLIMLIICGPWLDWDTVPLFVFCSSSIAAIFTLAGMNISGFKAK